MTKIFVWSAKDGMTVITPDKYGQIEVTNVNGLFLPDKTWFGSCYVHSAPMLERLENDPDLVVFPHVFDPGGLEQHHADKLSHIKAKAGDSMFTTAQALYQKHGLHILRPEI